MNILVEGLPSAVEIDGREYAINTDFRAALRVVLAFEDPELTPFEKQWVMLQNLYPEQPENLQSACAQAIKFLNGGRPGSDNSDLPGVRLYSFSHDADYIYSAFSQTHGIDLETAALHWWKFLALFNDLGADTAFCNLVGLRQRVKSGKATPEEMQQARALGDLATVPEPDTRTLEEKDREAEFMRLVAIGQAAREGK